ncbi:RidA family protein [Congregibacter litoralis]|uniref:Putative translation initiation inhibitor, yjgF family n=1 Tax=Congregibacter litoralis KT71 TaxID=314285 RepID=A4A9S2_9GAMM|nr:Rid family hydrolase [Congregibacter litoralis]EAQ97239.1 putative translation initiation inhibitor, yjgF family [Congregibacter litoralis KT71]
MRYLMFVPLLVLTVVAGARGAEVSFLNSSGSLAAELPFSEAVRVGDTLYLAGQLGALPGEMAVVEGGIVPETRQTLDNIRSTLKSHGLAMSDVVKCTVMLADISEWGAFNEVYAEFFSKPFPARSAFGANGLALNARVEVECIAAFSD